MLYQFLPNYVNFVLNLNIGIPEEFIHLVAISIALVIVIALKITITRFLEYILNMPTPVYLILSFMIPTIFLIILNGLTGFIVGCFCVFPTLITIRMIYQALREI